MAANPNVAERLKIDPNSKDEFYAYYRKLTPVGYANALRALLAMDYITGRLREIEAPTLLIGGDRDPSLVTAGFELLAGGPREIVQRYAPQAMEIAIRRGNEALATVVAESIINLELADSYSALAKLISSKLSEELYNYLAVLLAGTNRPELLAILEHELHRGRRPRIIAEALRIRTTPEHAAILERWESGDEP